MNPSVPTRTLSNPVHTWIADTVAERLAFHRGNPSARLQPSEVRARAVRTGTRDALFAAGLTMIPGPVGALTTPAEVWWVLRAQIRLVVDVAVAHGAEDRVDPDLVARIVLGRGGVSGKVASLALAKVGGRAARAALGRWVPVLGVLGVAIWTRKATLEIAELARVTFTEGLPAAEAHAQEAHAHEVLAPTDPILADVDRSTRPADPEGSQLDPELRHARYAALAHVVRNTPIPSAAQIARLDTLRARWSDDDCWLPPIEELIAGDTDPELNLPLLGQEAERVFREMVAVAKLADGNARPSVGGLESVGRSLGLSADTVERTISAA